jgi:uncharacterized protein with HEPN domain
MRLLYIKFNTNLAFLKAKFKHCLQIEETCKKFNLTFEKMLSEHTFQNSLMFDTQQIGELVTHLTKDFRLAHPQIPWTGIIKTRNIAVHEYEQFDFDILWKTIINDIPKLKLFCQQQLAAASARQASEESGSKPPPPRPF